MVSMESCCFDALYKFTFCLLTDLLSLLTYYLAVWKLFQELLQKLIQQRRQLRERDAHIVDLERYIDELLVKVIDLQPLLLSHDTSPQQSPPMSRSPSQLRQSEPRTNLATPARHTSPFIRQAASQRSRPGLKKFAIGRLQTLLKWPTTIVYLPALVSYFQWWLMLALLSCTVQSFLCRGYAFTVV